MRRRRAVVAELRCRATSLTFVPEFRRSSVGGAPLAVAPLVELRGLSGLANRLRLPPPATAPAAAARNGACSRGPQRRLQPRPATPPATAPATPPSAAACSCPRQPASATRRRQPRWASTALVAAGSLGGADQRRGCGAGRLERPGLRRLNKSRNPATEACQTPGFPAISPETANNAHQSEGSAALPLTLSPGRPPPALR
jgi:hypothetical protein